MNLTPNQRRAIDAPGNLLVVAAAGAGKTGTLVHRCTRLLLDPQESISIRQILVVTFTEAAAAEVRHRIRSVLEKEAAARPEDEHVREQLAQIDAAYITTLHSFCFDLVRRHTLELGLDPAISVMEPQQARVLFFNALDLLLRDHYEQSGTFSQELRQLIQSHFGGWDKGIREFVQRVHEYTQTRAAPDKWFDETLAFLSRDRCPEWHEWYRRIINEWCQWWLPYLKGLPPENVNGAACARILEDGCAKADLQVVSRIAARDTLEFWDGRKGKDRPAINKLFDEATFLASLLPEKAGDHPLDQDWEWMRQPLLTLLRFAREFADRFATEKIQRGLVDFHDLEQFALRLLVDSTTEKPTEIAQEWQKKFKAIFVDEYQDINTAQDLILAALSCHNRFLVGDMKQSIYRFRQADPRIFRTYLERPGWQTIPLSDNFRSHEGILQFVNPFFAWLMRPELGGINYDSAATLKFGAAKDRPEMVCKAGEKLPVELHLFLTNEQEYKNDDYEGYDETAELEDADIEARLVAHRLRELKESGFTIWDQKEARRRTVEWKDMVVLLRAAKNKLETYAKAFAAADVPLQTKRNGFFSTLEVLDLINVLQILDNPLQDIPLVAVLRSPVVGLTANELAAVRIHSLDKHFWRAVKAFVQNQAESSARTKLQLFLGRFEKWRDPKRCLSLAQRIESILVDTSYGDWLLAQERGRERYANVRQLLGIARNFDQTRGQSLYLFLRHVEEMQDAAADIEPAGSVEQDAVRLMTVHQSKGLEFPIVAVADLGKRFNFSALSSSFAMHPQFSLCAMIKPPHTGQRYPSLPLWLSRRSERFEAIGEEMRVLYVALTRAQNRLLLFGKSTRTMTETWVNRSRFKPLPPLVCKHQSWLDWLGTFASIDTPDWTQAREGVTNTFSYVVHEQAPELQKAKCQPAASARIDLEPFAYPHEMATRQAAKTSVTSLRQKAAHDEEAARPAVWLRGARDGTARGLATHAFLEHFDLSAAPDVLSLYAEAERLAKNHFLTREEQQQVDLEGVSAFWSSKIGQTLLRSPTELKRELPFTFKATAADLTATGLANVLSVPPGEFVVIQGIADLVRFTPKEIWLIDFKTDKLNPGELKGAASRYRSQVLLYAGALASIYKRPVTRKGIFFLNAQEFAWF